MVQKNHLRTQIGQLFFIRMFMTYTCILMHSHKHLYTRMQTSCWIEQTVPINLSYCSSMNTPGGYSVGMACLPHFLSCLRIFKHLFYRFFPLFVWGVILKNPHAGSAMFFDRTSMFLPELWYWTWQVQQHNVTSLFCFDCVICFSRNTHIPHHSSCIYFHKGKHMYKFEQLLSLRLTRFICCCY